MRATQRHHIIYDSDKIKRSQEEVVLVYKGEHGVLTKIQWWCRTSVSTGFIKALKVFIALNEDRALDLEKEKQDD